ncbi:MAG: hypothetical protein RIN56_20305 [Sporomusaceae bacterium]|nr:hypothetical protein [Sporomusaceae bacterium]
MESKAVVTIAIESKEGHNFTDAINEILSEMKRMDSFRTPPIAVKKIESYPAFEGLNYNCGIRSILNLHFLNSSGRGAPDLNFANIKVCLERMRPNTFSLIAISDGLQYYTEYSN